MNAALTADLCPCAPDRVRPDASPNRRSAAGKHAALTALSLAGGEKVLELYCSGGAALRAALQQVGADGFAAGVDPGFASIALSARAVRHAVAGGRAAVIRADVIDLPFRDNFFDKAFAASSYEAWPQPERALREIARVLGPGGLLAITLDVRPRQGGDVVENAARANALLRRLGWSLRDERASFERSVLRAVTLLARRPD